MVKNWTNTIEVRTEIIHVANDCNLLIGAKIETT